MREGEASVQREAGTWWTETEAAGGGTGSLILEVSVSQWPGCSVYCLNLHTTLLITRALVLAAKSLLTHTSLPELLDSNFAFLQPIWMPQPKDPLKTPWVMSLLSLKG